MPNKIVYVRNKLPNGFIGMNAMANRRLRVVKNHPENTFFIHSGMPKGKIERTIRHEEIEEHLMRMKGMSYDKKRGLSAHDVANLVEDDKDLIVKVKGSKRARGYSRSVM